MTTLSTQTFTQLVRNTVTAIQSAASTLLNLNVGSTLRAIVESFSGVVMWLQSMALQILSSNRLSTSSGSDVDTWMADYSLTRLAGQAASGLVMFSRFSAATQVVVPIGATVQSTDGTQDYTVTTDTTNVNYSATLGGYVMAVSVESIYVPVQADSVGLAGNAAIGGISVITSAIPGVDTVTNATALTNGEDAETDAAFRLRFQAYIAGLSKGTKAAIGYAIQSVKQDMSYTLTENESYSGATDYGYFYVVIDDGTGAPSSQVISDVTAAIDATRAFTVNFGVFGPVVVTANASMTLTIASGYDATAVKALVTTAVTNYLNTIPLGESVPYTRLAQVAYAASDGVTNVSSVLLNSGTADLSITAKQIAKAGTVTVS